MHKKTFGDRTHPGRQGELTALSRTPSLDLRGRGREGNKGQGARAPLAPIPGSAIVSSLTSLQHATANKLVV